MSENAQTLAMRRALPAALAARYNSVGLQRERIMDCLRSAGTAGVLGPELARLANVPCITKRISELRRSGEPIDKEPATRPAADGTVSVCARYVLRDGDAAQAELFGPTEGTA